MEIQVKINLAVVGDPISHSLSPVIHETVLQELGMDYTYRKIRVKKGELPAFLKSTDGLSLQGFNLTMPHKQDIIQHLDFIDEDARIFDSVNTVKADNNRLLGYNTDGKGCILSMLDKGYECRDKNIVILGAGGVVSTIALKTATEKAKKITVLNRTLSSAQALADNVYRQTGKEVVTATLTTENICEYCRDCDILINGTPLGMEGIDSDFDDFSFLKALNPYALVHDLIYKPQKTSLLAHANGLGLETLTGLGMLIYQGILADEIFLGVSLDLAFFKAKIEDKLKNF